MDDGNFDENFTWFEWGFVSPEDVQGYEQLESPVAVGAQALESWDEDHRWPT